MLGLSCPDPSPRQVEPIQAAAFHFEPAGWNVMEAGEGAASSESGFGGGLADVQKGAEDRTGPSPVTGWWGVGGGSRYSPKKAKDGRSGGGGGPMDDGKVESENPASPCRGPRGFDPRNKGKHYRGQMGRAGEQRWGSGAEGGQRGAAASRGGGREKRTGGGGVQGIAGKPRGCGASSRPRRRRCCCCCCCPRRHPSRSTASSRQ